MSLYVEYVFTESIVRAYRRNVSYEPGNILRFFILHEGNI